MSRYLRLQRSVHTAQTLHDWHFGLVDFKHVQLFAMLDLRHTQFGIPLIAFQMWASLHAARCHCEETRWTLSWRNSLWHMTHDSQKECLAQFFGPTTRVWTCFAGLPAVSSPGTAILMNSNLLHCGGANLPAAVGGSRRRLFYVAGFASTYREPGIYMYLSG